MSVSFACCVLSGRGIAMGRSLVQKGPIKCGVFIR
jgi:hypothetical protein